jgi:peptidoglycan/LPS O-acetylase OafA/YrhL
VQNKTHYSNLETLRGLAALMVAISHSFIALTFGGIDQLWGRPVWSIPIGSIDTFMAGIILAFANGGAAVTIFFILSGVVLGLSLDLSAVQNSFQKRYIIFIIKRIFRIYPAHVVLMLIICAVIIIFGIVNPGTFEKSSMWYNWYYRSIPNVESIIRNVLLLDVFLNPVTWTLKVEVAVALFFPVLHLISRIQIKYATLFQITILSVLIWLALLNPGNGMILPHVYKFYLGLLIPIYGSPLADRIKQYANIATSKIILIAVATIVIEKQLVHGTYQSYGLIETAGATLLVYTLMKNSSNWFFDWHVFKKLGQFSYSFYLWHFPVLWLMYYALHSIHLTQEFIINYAFITAIVVCLVSVFATYAIAQFSYWVVEHRMIILGRDLIAKLWK